MKPGWISNTGNKQLQRSKIRYYGIACTMSGFLLILITLITNGKLQKEYGLILILLPVLVSICMSMLVGLCIYIVVATKSFLSAMVLLYLGYYIDDPLNIKNK